MSETLNSQPELVFETYLQGAKDVLKAFLIKSLPVMDLKSERTREFSALLKNFDQVSAGVNNLGVFGDTKETLKLGLPTGYDKDEEGNDKSGLILKFLPKEAEELTRQLSPEQYSALCEFGLTSSINTLKKAIKDDEGLARIYSKNIEKLESMLDELQVNGASNATAEKIPLYSLKEN